MYTPPVTPWESIIPEVGSLTFKEGAIEGRIGDWGEVVTRYPYRKVGMDHLLSKEKKLILKLIQKRGCRIKENVLLGFERTFSQIVL